MPSGTVIDQVMTPDSPLSTFFERMLPGRSSIADEWRRMLARAPVAGLPLDRDRDVVGKAYEMRVGLDLAEQPGYWQLLAFLPANRCDALMRAAGFEAPDTEGAEPIIDPMQRAWTRTSAPIVNDTAQVQALSSCFDAACWSDMAHRVGRSWPVQWSRAAPGTIPRIGAEHRRTAEAISALTGLARLWDSYLEHGRRQLLELGSRVILEPTFAPGFAEGDMIVGRTLVEVKTYLNPAPHLERWLDQLLAYVLLDQWDIYFLTDLALFAGWEATLCRSAIDVVLQVGSSGPTPTLVGLRSELADVLHDDLGNAYRAHMHRRYPPPAEVWVRPDDLPDSPSTTTEA